MFNRTASKLFEFVFNLISLVGIGLAVWGGIWAYLYRGKPKPDDYKRWENKYTKKHGEIEFKDLERGFVDPGMVYDADNFASHRDFNKGWRRKRIVGVVLGLVGAAIASSSQVILSMLGL